MGEYPTREYMRSDAHERAAAPKRRVRPSDLVRKGD
jgi:hypothetical protein